MDISYTGRDTPSALCYTPSHALSCCQVDVLYGRKGGASATPPSPKWIESYTMPGQFIALRFPPREEGGSSSEGASKDPRLASRLYSLASSPYESRRDSYNFDASIIEVGASSSCKVH